MTRAADLAVALVVAREEHGVGAQTSGPAGGHGRVDAVGRGPRSWPRPPRLGCRCRRPPRGAPPGSGHGAPPRPRRRRPCPCAGSPEEWASRSWSRPCVPPRGRPGRGLARRTRSGGRGPARLPTRRRGARRPSAGRRRAERRRRRGPRIGRPPRCRRGPRRPARPRRRSPGGPPPGGSSPGPAPRRDLVDRAVPRRHHQARLLQDLAAQALEHGLPRVDHPARRAPVLPAARAAGCGPAAARPHPRSAPPPPATGAPGQCALPPGPTR